MISLCWSLANIISKFFLKERNTIIECVIKDGKWVVMRTREDKTGPNDIGVYHKIMESIREPVLKEHLLL